MNKSALELAREAFEDLANDPLVWATHGLPDEAKAGRIISRIAQAIFEGKE